MTLGEKFSPIFEEIHNALWEHEARFPGEPFKFTTKGFRGGVKIFMSVLLDAIWAKQEIDEVPQGEREKQVYEAGEKIRKLVKQYTGIDTFDLYERPTEN